jgi:hypothetical protein
MARDDGGGAEGGSGPDGVWKVSRKLVQCAGCGRGSDEAVFGAVSLRFEAAAIAPPHPARPPGDVSKVRRCRTAEKDGRGVIAFLGVTIQHRAMSTLHLVPDDLRELYYVKEWRNATGVLQTACPDEWSDIVEVLREFRLLKSEVIAKGGRKSPVANRIDGGFYARGWAEKKFDTAISVDDYEYASPTHSVDCFKGRVGVEVEWNNKDPFYDRDLNNFRLLFDLRVIDVGIIITRSSELQTIFKQLGKGDSYGASTTHHEKLWPRLEGGGGGGCPVLTFAIRPQLFVDDIP